MKPRIIMPEELAEKLSENANRTVLLYGHARPTEGLVQVFGLEPADELMPIARQREGNIEVIGSPHSVPLSEIGVIRINEEFTSRSRSIIDTNDLAIKKVAFIGVGSVGSLISLHLAQSAVGRFILFDPDTFSAANLSRHVCDVRDLERFKTKAVRDMIRHRNAQAAVQTLEEDFLDLSWPEQIELLQGCDLVIATTDSTPAQFAVNEACHHLKIPSLYVGAYERACAGEVLFVMPGETPCFNCFMEFRQSGLSDTKKTERRLAYSDAEGSELQAEPGLAIDIAFIVAVASAYALALLLKGSARRALLDLQRNLALVHAGVMPQGRYSEIFRYPFEILLAHVRRDKECPVCQKAAANQENEDEESTKPGRDIIR